MQLQEPPNWQIFFGILGQEKEARYVHTSSSQTSSSSEDASTTLKFYFRMPNIQAQKRLFEGIFYQSKSEVCCEVLGMLKAIEKGSSLSPEPHSKGTIGVYGSSGLIFFLKSVFQNVSDPTKTCSFYPQLKPCLQLQPRLQKQFTFQD